MKAPRSDFTLEFRKEAVRLVHSRQRQSQVSALPGLFSQTLHNWDKAEEAEPLTASFQISNEIQASRIALGHGEGRI